MSLAEPRAAGSGAPSTPPPRTSVLRRFRNAALGSAERPARSDNVLYLLALSSHLAHPPLNELSPLERLVFCAPFLALLFPSLSAPSTGAKRALRLDAVKFVRQVLHPALNELGKPAQSVHDLAELSPHPISRLLLVLRSDLYPGDAPSAPTESANLEQAPTDDDGRSFVLAAVRGRLGPYINAQALARPAPAAVLCSLELARAVLTESGSLGGDGDGVEMHVAQQHFDMIKLAQREGNTGRPGGGVDVGSWIRAVHELHQALRWGDVVRGFDSPLRAPAEGPLALRALAAALPLSPAPITSGLWAPRANWDLQFSLVERTVFLALMPLDLQAQAQAGTAQPRRLSHHSRSRRSRPFTDSGPTTKTLAAQVHPSA
ncbi:hypothetical protein Rhopal_007632-T1 [Rhodotorula paludigena]|uniref:Uncharacterized protein n=1 Tax=Rhodotorula paludigena TaxID=86838 RepID=A0AAV5GZA8_9BASI|nr:hypothetical protein Rhopal_007632-T1 [Rhodotorula paludigena]